MFLHFWSSDLLAAWLALYAMGNLIAIADAGLQIRAINRFLAFRSSIDADGRTGHHLGLDVHDVGDTWRKVTPGMVFTIEPGIYIKEEKLGVRLENDVLITRNGSVDLMAEVPIEVEEIEDLMGRNGKQAG